MADHRSDPSALRFLIGHDLRATRERAGFKQVEAGRVLDCSQAKINYLETGKTQQKPDDVTVLLRAYGADAEHVDRMASLAASADHGTWWAPFGDVLTNWFKPFLGLEGLASAEFLYKPLLLPGQLQTPDYAAALLVGNLRVPPRTRPWSFALAWRGSGLPTAPIPCGSGLLSRSTSSIEPSVVHRSCGHNWNTCSR